MWKFVPFTGRAACIAIMEASDLCRLWRFSLTLNQQKAIIEGQPPHKDVKNEGRSGNVYENKGSSDTLTEIISGICAWLKPVLQKTSALEGLNAVNNAFERDAVLRCWRRPASLARLDRDLSHVKVDNPLTRRHMAAALSPKGARAGESTPPLPS